MTPTPRTFRLTDERSIEALVWGVPDAPVIVALHGWLDNAESFYKIAPLLDTFQVVAIDLAGHGRSGWRSRDAGYSIWGYVEDLYAIQCQLGLPKIRLLAHSLGAGIASLYAGVFPERVSHAGLIENLGPMVDEPEQCALQLREAIEHRLNQEKPQLKARSKEVVIRSRALGRFPVPFDAAERLILRACHLLEDDQCLLSYDSALKDPSLLRLTEPQVVATLKSITASVLVITGQNGLNIDLTQQRLPFVKKVEQVTLPGGHHLHLEEAVLPELSRTLIRFFDTLER